MYNTSLQHDLEELKNQKTNENTWTISEIRTLLSSDQDEFIYSWADEVRKKYCGDEVHIRGIIEFSNYCRSNCFYCGIRKDNECISRYTLDPDAIISLAEEIYHKYNINSIVLQSGEDFGFEISELAEIIKEIKSKTDLAITLCIGERSFEEYKLLKEAGADRYLLKQETFSKELYNTMHPNMSFDNRIKCMNYLKELNFQVGSGNLIGLPNQTLEDIAVDIYYFQKYYLDMIAIGPFIPHANTPFANEPMGDPELTIKAIAITRIITKNAHIPATTALGAIDPKYQVKALESGANVIMINFTPSSERQNYDIYPSKDRINLIPDQKIKTLKETLKSIGRQIGQGRGDSLK